MQHRMLIVVAASLSSIGLQAAAEPFFNLTATPAAIGGRVAIQIEDASFDVIVVSDGKLAGPVSLSTSAGDFILDVSKNPEAELELVRNATLNHGDLRQPLVNVKGALVYRKLKGDPRKELRHVIVVESLKVRLGDVGIPLGPFPIE